MIKANELRAGNYVYTNTQTSVIMQPGGIHAIYQGRLDVYPIPLTPEILTKCGFANDRHIKANCWYLEKDKNAGYLVLPVCDNGSELTNSPILYLHQLQNLYFALTGEELDINL